MPSPINTALLQLTKRAEANDSEKLIETFVDVGPLETILKTSDHQIIFGRRGTGKTHALNYLSSAKKQEGHAVVDIDLRNIGSNGGLYADESIPLALRASGLLVDTLKAIHDQLYDFCVRKAADLDLSQTGPALDEVADAITTVRVVGTIEQEEKSDIKVEDKTAGEIVVSASKGGVKLDSSSSNSFGHASARRVSGREILSVNFGATGTAFKHLIDRLKGARLFILLDEWSSVPLQLQPYLADLLRRCLLPLNGVTLKIAAIEHRSNFRIVHEHGTYIGIELGADASADVNLDDFMVFDNDPNRAIEFFETLIGRHVIAAVAGTDLADKISTDARMAFRSAFTERRAIDEFVRSSEGVPRDALYLISLAAQRSLDNPISVNDVRVAAKNWYQRDKEKAVTADDAALTLLHRVIDDVIGTRKARAFLLRSGAKHPLIDSLYDARVLHILKRGISTHDQPGVRYDVYKIDYGCYVDLLTTANAPEGLLQLDDGNYAEVPPDDYRSIRRAILDL